MLDPPPRPGALDCGHPRQAVGSPVGQAILPAAAFQAALEPEQTTRGNSMASCLPAIAPRRREKLVAHRGSRLKAGCSLKGCPTKGPNSSAPSRG